MHWTLDLLSCDYYSSSCLVVRNQDDVGRSNRTHTQTDTHTHKVLLHKNTRNENDYAAKATLPVVVFFCSWCFILNPASRALLPLLSERNKQKWHARFHIDLFIDC